jgi:ABC-2 type transport system ATP-binding protein
MTAQETMISINGLTKDFGPLRAVDDISFDVKKGEVLGFLGPNGAGKSTTMKMVTGYLPITKGRASVCGFDVETHSLEAKTKIGYLPEGAPLYGDMTTTGFLNFIAEIRGLKGDAKNKQVAFAIDKLQLQTVMNQPIDTLSKGFKRRVGFAQAILHDPEVLILDEPTDGLDPNQKHQVRELISEMAANKAIVISTHILEEVEAVCTRAVIIADGKIVFDDTPANLKARSSTGSLDDVFRELTLVN